MVGMAGGVQHQRRGEPMRGVPAVAGADGFVFAIGQAGAGQAVVLDVIGEEDLALGVQREGGPGQKAGETGDQAGKDKGGGAAGKGKCIGVQALGGAGAEVGFGAEPLAEAADPGAAGETVEAFAQARGVRVFGRGDGAVVNQTMRAGVLAEEEDRVADGAEAEEAAVRLVDQFMRGGVDDLTKPEAGGEEGDQALGGGKGGRAGDGPGGKGEKREGAEADGKEEEVGSGKLAAFGLTGNKGDELIEDQCEAGHVKEGGPEPGASKREAEAEEGERQERGCGEGGEGEGAGQGVGSGVGGCGAAFGEIGPGATGFSVAGWRPMRRPIVGEERACVRNIRVERRGW